MFDCWSVVHLRSCIKKIMTYYKNDCFWRYNYVCWKTCNKRYLIHLFDNIFLAGIKRKNENYCPEKCQTKYNCKTDNLVCPTCQDGWGGSYCHRKFYRCLVLFFFIFFLEKWFTRFIKHFSLNTILYHSIEKHKNSINIESDNRKCLKVYCWEGGMGS